MSDIIPQDLLQHVFSFDEPGLKANSDEQLFGDYVIPVNEIVPRKRCSHCRQIQPITSFCKNRSGKHGVHNVCKQCAKEQTSEYMHRNPESPRACSKCKEIKPCSEFYGASAPYCKQCHKKWMQTAEGKMYARNASLKQKFNITHKDYESMLLSQGGVCAICGQPPQEGKHLHVDHCHKTGVIRALLCRGCNIAIGCTYENPDVLRRAALYVEKHNAAS